MKKLSWRRRAKHESLPVYQTTNKDLKINLTHELMEKEFLEKENQTKHEEENEFVNEEDINFPDFFNFMNLQNLPLPIPLDNDACPRSGEPLDDKVENVDNNILEKSNKSTDDKSKNNSIKIVKNSILFN